MYIIAIILSIVLSLFSTIVMSYVAMATPIGPWIAPTLVFTGLLYSKLCKRITTTSLSYAVCAGSIGGILATACGFSFPTLFFLDPSLFNTWMESPLFFSAMLGSLAFLAGAFGLLIADFSEKSLIEDQKLPFPIGELIQKMIATHNQMQKSYELMVGFIMTALLYILQAGSLCTALLPRLITIVHAQKIWLFSFPRIALSLDTTPMIVAIGFVTGHVITLPLAIGALSMIFFVTPIHTTIFSYLSQTEFVLAFCSGVIFYTTGISLITLPQQCIQGIKKAIARFSSHKRVSVAVITIERVAAITVLTGALTYFFSYLKFPYSVQLYLIVCSAITTYQIAAIAGRIGLALLGRFATFVMIPACFIFNLNFVHIVFIATFVEISGGVATDVLFGRKVAQLSGISQSTIRWFQLLGLVVSSLSIGIVFWCLINHFGLGSSELFAYRAQSRQLLLQAQQFDYSVMLLGAFFGCILAQCKINPMLALGGLLMPVDITICLIAGGSIALLSHDKEEWFPFWSGVFASSSICMLIRSIIMFFA